MKTYMAKKGDVDAQWHVVDLDGQVLGRAATTIATLLMGKHRPEYTPHVDTGDFVIVINAEKARLTGRKDVQRRVTRFSGYPDGLHEASLGEEFRRHPTRVVTNAVRRMLPKSRLGKQMLTKLKVYAGSDHPHQAQQPQPYAL
ncbi:MAG: 50S ribosomal protein L13 [Phycisphaerae bacterium]|jgi:large subunit ribosomal protein L13|nr:50S ribosomal protein L13 [Phycisphaerae bacterium]